MYSRCAEINIIYIQKKQIPRQSLDDFKIFYSFCPLSTKNSTKFDNKKHKNRII